MGEARFSTSRTFDGTAVVEVRGELDFAASQDLRQTIEDAIHQLRPHTLVVDLGLVTFIDSTAIGALVAASDAARSLGGRLRVRPSPFVAQQLHTTGLYQTLVNVA